MKYFGTDGIRRLFSEELLGIATKVGYALSKLATHILIAEDTRQSSPTLRNAVATGSIHGGATVTFAGIMPTPALSQAVRLGHYDLGVMITASHNPKEYNGIKVFDNNGFKIGDNTILEIEALLENAPDIKDSIMPPQTDIERTIYIDRLTEQLDPKKQLSVLLDCANGATMTTAPYIFYHTNIITHIIGTKGDINDGCGVFFLNEAKERKIQEGAELAFIFDGDGDRIMCIDEENEILDGDTILYILAKDHMDKGELTNRSVAGTLFSSLALENSLKEIGIKLIRSQVGDRFLVDEMTKNGIRLGSEPSGHIVIDSNTGDGVKTAVVLANLSSSIPLSVRKRGYKHTYISETSLPFSDKAWEYVKSEAKLFMQDNNTTNRLLVRRSGTEPVIRILIETESKALNDTIFEKFQKLSFDIR